MCCIAKSKGWMLVWSIIYLTQTRQIEFCRFRHLTILMKTVFRKQVRCIDEMLTSSELSKLGTGALNWKELTLLIFAFPRFLNALPSTLRTIVSTSPYCQEISWERRGAGDDEVTTPKACRVPRMTWILKDHAQNYFILFFPFLILFKIFYWFYFLSIVFIYFLTLICQLYCVSFQNCSCD
jgi:hypothetical protein